MAIRSKTIRDIYQRAEHPDQFFTEFGQIVIDEFSAVKQEFQR